jgi:hypothetical protein
MSDRTIKIPDFPRNWGPFLGYSSGITISAFGFAAMARTETAVLVVGFIAAVALIVGLVATLKRVDVRPNTVEGL